jgi:regulator of protease activity HflC (stomatin/prohibitin superfamily)
VGLEDLTLAVGVLVDFACIAASILLAESSAALLAIVPVLATVVVLTSLVVVQPGQTKVVRFFGSYVGTVRHSGLWWILPLADRRNLSIRVRNFETNHWRGGRREGNRREGASGS